MLLPIHVAAGGLALVLGAVALSVKKGGTIHRRSGLLFVYAMLVMGITASILGNVGGGLLVVYFVVTALRTVRPVSPWTRGINIAALTVAVAFTLVSILGGVNAFNSPRGFLNGVPFLMFFFLATVTLLAAIGDVRIMRFGVPRGGPRLARHLWRMCFALFIAAGSFFSIRERVAKILPEPFTTKADARVTDPAVRRDVQLVVEGPRPPPVASGHPTRMNREINPQVYARVGGILYLIPRRRRPQETTHGQATTAFQAVLASGPGRRKEVAR